MNEPNEPDECERVRRALGGNVPRSAAEGDCPRREVEASSADLNSDLEAGTVPDAGTVPEHLARCEPCRRAAAVDEAVRLRLLERADAPTPIWHAGFAERVAKQAVLLAREAKRQNRLLWMSAAAAALVAAFVFETAPRRAAGDRAPGESTRTALFARLVSHRALEGK